MPAKSESNDDGILIALSQPIDRIRPLPPEHPMVWNFVIQLVISLALMAISYALTPRPKTAPPKAAGLDEFDVPTAEEGRPIPVVFGTVLLRGPNVVWAGDLRVDPIRKKGGKK